MNIGKIGLFGAGGALGRNMAPVLDARGIPYRVVGRNESRLQKTFPHTEVARADFLTGDGIEEAASGIETIFYFAGAPYTHFEQHPVMVGNAIAAAKTACVDRFIHVAPVYSYGPPLSRPVSESQPHTPTTRKGTYRLLQEQLVLAAHGPALRTLIVQLPDFYGPHAQNSFTNYFMNEAVAGKPATFIGPLGVIREFIYVPDVPAPLLDLAAIEDAYGRYWNLGGAGGISGAQFAKRVFEVLDAPYKVKSVSKLELRLVGILNPLMREFVEMFYLYDSGFVLDDSDLHARIGDIEKTPYDKGIRETLGWMKHSAENMSR